MVCLECDEGIILIVEANHINLILMDQTLIVVEPDQSCAGRCAFNCCLCIKIGSLVALTYGLMVLMFFIW
jgi:hypothetical protein